MSRRRYEGCVDVTVQALEEFICRHVGVPDEKFREALKSGAIVGADYQPRHGTVRFYFAGDGLLPTPEGGEPVLLNDRWPISSAPLKGRF